MDSILRYNAERQRMNLENQWRSQQSQGGQQQQQGQGGYFTGAGIGAPDRFQPDFAGTSVAQGTDGYGQALMQSRQQQAQQANPQQNQLDSIARLEQQGLLHPVEAERMKQIALAGGNAFDKPTIAEKKASGEGMTPYQEQSAMGRAQRDEYERRRQAIKDKIDSVEHSNKTATGPQRVANDAEIGTLKQSLVDLPDSYGQPVSSSKAPTTQPSRGRGSIQITSRSTAAPADTPGGQADRRDADYLVTKYGSARAAREAYQRGERAPH